MPRLLALLLSCTFAASAHAESADNMNFRFGPIGLIVGAISVHMDFKLTDEWTLGPELQYWQLTVGQTGGYTEDFKVTAASGGARANWFANGTYTDGLYVAPSLQVYSVKVKTRDTGGEVTASASGPIAGVLVGYGWFWDSFNMMLGGGVQVMMGNAYVKVKDSTGEETNVASRRGGLDIEYTLGWTF